MPVRLLEKIISQLAVTVQLCVCVSVYILKDHFGDRCAPAVAAVEILFGIEGQTWYNNDHCLLLQFQTYQFL